MPRSPRPELRPVGGQVGRPTEAELAVWRWPESFVALFTSPAAARDRYRVIARHLPAHHAAHGLDRRRLRGRAGTVPVRRQGGRWVRERTGAPEAWVPESWLR